MSKRILAALSLLTALAFFAITSQGWIPDDADGDGVPDSVDACPTVDASYFDRNGDGCIDDPRGARHLEYWGWQDSIITYVINDQGEPTVGDGSDFTAVQNAFNAWTSIPGVDIDAAYGGTTVQAIADGLDGVNLVTFIDTATPISSLVLALGVATSFEADTLIGGRIYRRGEIYDADMIFNPTRFFTTPGSGGVGTDIQAVSTHEAGHVFGLSHSAVLSSSLFYVLQAGVGGSSLETEDETIFLKAYPDTSTLNSANRIDGTVIDGNTSNSVPGAIVFAIDAVSGDTAACDYTLPDGSYTMFGLADGSYYIAIHALDGTAPIGFIQPGNINSLVQATAVTLLVPEYWDLAESATDDPTAQDPIAVSGGSAATADLVTNVDNMPPVVADVTPDDGTPSYPIDGALIIEFDEGIDSSTLSANFSLKNGVTGAGSAGSIAILRDDSVIAFTPSPPLQYGVPYELTLGTGLADKFGNTLPVPYTMTYTTEPEPPINVTSVSPGKGVVGTTVVVNGSGFDQAPPPVVTFAGGVNAQVVTATPLQLTVAVPFGATTGSIVVQNTSDAAEDSISFTLLSSVEIARGFESGQTLLSAAPTSIAVTPSGDWAYVGQTSAMTAMVVNPSLPGYLNPVAIAYTGAIDAVSAQPDGRRVYGVSTSNMEFIEINSNTQDPPGIFNQVLNVESMDTEPLDIAVDPFGQKAYITTRESEIQVWDIKLGSVTFRQQVGVMPASSGLRGPIEITPDGTQAYALTDLGDLLLYDLGPDTLRTSVPVGVDPRNLRIDPVGQRAYVTHGNGNVTIVALTGSSAPFVVTDIATGGSLRGMGITPAGSYLYATDRTQDKMKIVDLVQSSATWRTVISDFPLDTNPIQVELSPDGVYAFSLLQGSGASPSRMLVTTIGLGPELEALTPRAGVADAVVTLAGEGMGDFVGFSGTVLFNGGSWPPSPPAFSPTFWGARVPSGALTGPVRTRQTIDIPPHEVEESNEIYFEVLGDTDPAAALRQIKSVPVRAGGNANGVIAISADGRSLYLGGSSVNGGEVYVYDTDPTSASFETLINSFAITSQDVDDIAITADGKVGFAVDSGAQEIVTFWASRTHPLFGKGGPAVNLGDFILAVPTLVVASPDNQYVAVWDDVGDGIGEILIIDASGVGDGVQPEAVDMVSVGEGVTDILFDPYALFLYVAQQTPPRVFTLSGFGGWTVGNIALFPGAASQSPTSMAFTPDMRKLYIRTVDQFQGIRTVHEYIPVDLIDPLQPDTLTFVNTWGQGTSGTALVVRDVMRVSPRNDRAVISFANSGIGFWELPDLFGGQVNVSGLQATSAPHGMEFSLDGDRLYVASTDPSELQVFDFAGSANLVHSAGDGQTGVVNEVLPVPLRVTVVDPATTSPLPGAQVTFRVTTGGGGVGGGGTFVDQVVSITNISGQAQTQWKLGPVIGEQTVEITADLLGFRGTNVLTCVATGIAVPDTVPLTLSVVAPSGVANVGVNTPTLVTFNRGLDRATVSSSSLYLRKSGETDAVSAAYGYTQDDARVSLTPIASLDNGTTYEVVVTAALQDTSGNALTNAPAPGTDAFSTVAAGPPQLFSVNPPGGVITADVVLSGLNFDPTPSNNTVLFNAVSATPKSGNTGQLIVTVPKTAVSGEVSVVVGPDTTEGLDFNVLTPSSTTIDDVIATIGTANNLKGVAVGPDGVAYCVSQDGDVVIPVSPDSLISLPSIPVGDQPVAVAIDALAKLAYVCNFNSNTASVIDVDVNSSTYNTVVATIIVGSNPIDVAVFPGTVFIANAGSSNINVIDSDPSSANQNAVLATIGTGNTGARGVAVGPDGARLYVGTDGGFVVIDLSTNAVLATAGLGTGARGVAVGPDGALLYLLGTDGDLYVIDIQEGSPSENAVIATIGTGNARGVAVGPDGGTIWLTQEDSDDIIVIAVSAIPGVSVIYDGAAPSFTFEYSFVDTITVAGAEVVAFDPRGNGQYWVAGGPSVTLLGFIQPVLMAEVTVKPRSILIPVDVDSCDPDDDDWWRQWRGRYIRGWIEPDTTGGFTAQDIDIATVRLNGVIPAMPRWPLYGDRDWDGIQELRVKFDRELFQEIIPEGDAVPAEITGEFFSGEAFIGVDSIRTYRPLVTSPAAGDMLIAGTVTNVTWESPAGKYVDFVDVHFTCDDGATWTPVAEGIPDNGFVEWIVPAQFSDSCRVMVTLYKDFHKICFAIGAGMSEVFSITMPVAVTMGSVNARAEDGTAVLRWQTATEVGVRGFRLHRSEDLDGIYREVSEGLIPATNLNEGNSYEYRDDTVEANRTYYYKLEEVTRLGAGQVFGPYKVTMRLVFALEQNHPNPFNPTTTIKFAIPEDSQVRLDVYDVAGRRVVTLVNEHRRANFYTVDWDGLNDRGNYVASGVYFYRLVAGHQTQTRKMMLLK